MTMERTPQEGTNDGAKEPNPQQHSVTVPTVQPIVKET
eukprot:CAMPEP_0114002872 /NCGR_PEP_ID=MMETSP0372-20130328/1694_1 /TAXON_ID=340204 /ORGANISM="Lankesteria abbotti" /LENGTH=37 /assembly_acc=CAM_ASM_000359